MSPIAPDRTYCVNDILRRKPIALRNLRFASRTSAKLAAFLKQLGTRAAMDRPVHSSAAQQRSIRRIHNRIDSQFRDISLNNFHSVHTANLPQIVSAEKLYYAGIGARTACPREHPRPSS